MALFSRVPYNQHNSFSFGPQHRFGFSEATDTKRESAVSQPVQNPKFYYPKSV